MDGWWRLLNLPCDVGNVLFGLVKYQTWPRAARISFTLSLFLFVPLLRVARVRELDIFEDLIALPTTSIQGIGISLLRFGNVVGHLAADYARIVA